MSTLSETQRVLLRELQERIVGADQAAQAAVTALQNVLSGLHAEKNVLVRLLAREHGIPEDQVSIDLQTGTVGVRSAAQEPTP